jgi:prepilin-type N-terminal cleavage/methylation domain-containing protein
MKLKTKLDKNGFTIVELLIATAILSLIILLSTAVIVSIGSLYYKGIVESQVQGNARNLIDDISKQIELSDTPVNTSTAMISFPGIVNPVAVNSYCVGTTRYTAIVGYQVLSEVPEVLWRDQIPTGSTNCPTLTSSTLPWNAANDNGTELISPGSMLTYFQITALSDSGLYSIQVSVAYGQNPTLAPNSSLLNFNDTGYALTTCNGGTSAGSQFCATANQQTTVAQRL